MSATVVASSGTHHGRCGSAPVATMTWSGRRSATSPEPHADAVLDRHTETPALGELVADHVAELGTVRHGRREPDLTAGLRALSRTP